MRSALRNFIYWRHSMSNIITFKNKVPVTNERITAVTRYDKSGLLIRDYEKGNPINKGVVANILNSDIAIHEYPFVKDNVYIEETVKKNFMYMFGTYMESRMAFFIEKGIVGESLESMFKKYLDIFR